MLKHEQPTNSSSTDKFKPSTSSSIVNSTLVSGGQDFRTYFVGLAA